jgi:hypothetical protein
VKTNNYLLTACLKGLLLTGLLLSSVAQAVVDVKCYDDTDGNCISEIADGGLWNSFGFGQCFYILPTALPREREEPVGPTVVETEGNPDVCIGGLDPLNLTTNDDIDVRIFKGGEGSDPPVPESNAFSWTYGTTYPFNPVASQFIPDSCAIGDLDSPNRRNGTFDNGDKFDPDDPRFVIEPMSAEFTLDTDVTGNATLSYYFMNGSEECRSLDWELKVNGGVVLDGSISNFRAGKYLVFKLTGLEGGETIRLDVVNPFQPGGGTPDGCPVDLISGVNSVISGVFLSGTSVCTPPELAALGDRVWEDRNGNGVQDCEDGGANDPNFPADGIIGNAGDAGPECDAGIPEVPVKLLDGDCQTPLDQMVMTDPDGFYLFPDLVPGDYCVEFGKPPVDFCDTDDFDLGEPQFTTQNAGNDDAVDSDADTATGVTDPVSLAGGETDLTVDAGIICPAKIGDRVWSDDNENGIQDDNEDGVEDVKVTLFECGEDMVAGTADDVDTGEMRTTGTDGMYMFGAEPDFTLDPGKYYVQFMKPDGTEFTTPNVNGDAVNSDCLPPNGITACTTLGPRDINLDRDCGLIPPPPPECDLELDKTCRVETPPVTGDLECEAKIAATELEYIGSGTPVAVMVEGKNNKASVVSSFDPGTGILTIEARPEDLGAKMTITTDGVAEVIHTSCSTPYVAGLPAPLDNPSGEPSANWLVLSFVDKNGGSASVPDDGDSNGDGDGVFTDNCTITQPSLVTYRYVVTNNGDALSNVLVTDDPLGAIGGPINMTTGQTETFYTSARITETTVNTGMAVGKLSDDSNCPASDSTTVTLEVPPEGGEGCTPGYWKKSHHFDSWVGFGPGDDYETVFGVDASFDKTLLGALWQGGGGEKALGRHAVAALLNSSNSDVSYAFTKDGVIQIVQDAYATGRFEAAKNQLKAENEQGCPLN